MKTPEPAEPALPMDLPQIIEALLVATPEPLSTGEIVATLKAASASAAADEKEKAKARREAEESGSPPPPAAEPAAALAYGKIKPDEVTEALTTLARTYEESGRAFTVLERAGGWKIFTRGEFAPWVRHLFPEKKPDRLSAPALETLAIIAYRQPITKSAIEAVRGVSVDGVMQKLLDRNIVRIAGRAELPGRPLLYETTELFFEHFGIRNVDDLPNAAELRTVKLPDSADEPTIESDGEQQEEQAADSDRNPAADAADDGESPAATPENEGADPGNSEEIDKRAEPAAGDGGEAGDAAPGEPEATRNA